MRGSAFCDIDANHIMLPWEHLSTPEWDMKATSIVKEMISFPMSCLKILCNKFHKLYHYDKAACRFIKECIILSGI